MKKIYCIAFCLLGLLSSLFSQKVAHTGISKTNISLRGNAVVLGQVTINAPSAGKVILRFDGHCLSSEGDRIVLAASQTTNWGPNDECVELEAANVDVNSNAFSHTRAYDVPAGDQTFYAVAQNFFEMDGSGTASIYGSLTAEWFPEIHGKAFARHKGFFYENIPVEGAPTAFNSLTIDAPVSGKVLVRFDGKCVSSYGDLMFFAASNTPTWSDYDGSTSNEVIDNDLNRFSFSHARMYNVAAGSHTFYAVVENFYEVYGNGFASVYGSLTVQFYPETEGQTLTFQPVTTPFGVNIEGPPVTVGQISLNAPVEGKVEINFVGTCIGSNGDQLRLAASNTPNWGPEDNNITFEPYSSDLNRMSFSHTRVYDVAAGNHDFYAVVQNYEEFEGSGLAVIYASFTAKYFPEGMIAVQEPEAFRSVKVWPNPASDFVHVEFAELSGEAFSLALCDQNGRILKTFEKSALDFSQQLKWEVSGLPAGTYFVKFTNTSGTALRPLIHR
ncbi:MAG: T9SS type A sorting domain-containing protein [Saprospiraceae bacterium]|nr:T9SS type A sorting domain-containing protein [Saprospiraceae bacterium]